MANKRITEADSDVLRRASRSVGSGEYRVPITSIEGFQNVNAAQFRLDYAKDTLNDILPGFSRYSWGNVQEQDAEFSNYTSATLTGSSASELGVMLLDAADQNKLSVRRESDEDDETQSYMFYNSRLPDMQIFFDDSTDGTDIVTLVVRPLEIDQEVTILI